MSSSFPNGIHSMKLKVSNFEQEISSASLGGNSIKITEQNILTALQSGVTINPSMVVTYSNAAFSSGTGTSNVEVAGTPYIPHPTWIQRGADIDGEANSNYSGYSVSLSADGNTLAIGADSNAGGDTERGHVRVYAWNEATTTWVQRGADIDGEANYDYSGANISLSADGSRVAIGADGNDASGNLLSNAGHVRVYQYDATKTSAQMNQTLPNFGPIGWNRLGGDIDGEASNDSSGRSVSLSADGSIVAIGAIFNDGIGSDAGHVRVYQYDATKTSAQMNEDLDNFGPVGWNRLGADIDGEAAFDYSGISVSLSADGSRVAIGADSNDASGNLLSNAGHVRVYQYDASKTTAQMDEAHANFGPIGWNRLGGDIDGEAVNDYSGRRSVSLSADGSIVAVGAIANDATGSTAGHVRVYQYNASKTYAQMNEAHANFGPVGWDRLGADIDGEAAFDQSGYSVSLSADGSRVAIGAHGNDASGNLLSNAGHVRVYQYDASKTSAQMNEALANFGPIGWNRLGGDIDGEAAGDVSGRSVSLSTDGSVLAIGAPYNAGGGANRGHVRVYNGVNFPFSYVPSPVPPPPPPPPPPPSPPPVIVNAILDLKSVSGYFNRFRIYYTLTLDIVPSDIGVLYASASSGFIVSTSGSFVTISEGSYSIDFIVNSTQSITGFSEIKLYNSAGTTKYAEIMNINVSGSV